MNDRPEESPDEYLGILVHKFPIPCVECGKTIFRAVRDFTDTRQIVHFCPHHHALIHAQVETLDDKPAVTKWICEGPTSEAAAMATITHLGNQSGAELTVFTGLDKLN